MIFFFAFVRWIYLCLLSGTSWVEVESPGKEMEALHVSVGVSVVWVVTKDYKVTCVLTCVCPAAQPALFHTSAPLVSRCGSGEG